jgi:hypothetical protein
MREIGLDDEQPTTMYPGTKIVSRQSRQQKEKYMDIRVFKIREWILDRHIKLRYCKTLSMIADLGTKSSSTKQFIFLRDVMNGYALVRAPRVWGKQQPERGGDELHGHQH